MPVRFVIGAYREQVGVLHVLIYVVRFTSMRGYRRAGSLPSCHHVEPDSCTQHHHRDKEQRQTDR